MQILEDFCNWTWTHYFTRQQKNWQTSINNFSFIDDPFCMWFGFSKKLEQFIYFIHTEVFKRENFICGLLFMKVKK